MNASSLNASSTHAPRRKCSNCGHFPLVRLDKFGADDIGSAPTVDAVVPGRAWGVIAPEASLLVIVSSWLGNLFFGAAKTARLRAKVRRARSELLPRSPDALICPECGETLEIL